MKSFSVAKGLRGVLWYNSTLSGTTCPATIGEIAHEAVLFGEEVEQTNSRITFQYRPLWSPNLLVRPKIIVDGYGSKQKCVLLKTTLVDGEGSLNLSIVSRRPMDPLRGGSIAILRLAELEHRLLTDLHSDDRTLRYDPEYFADLASTFLEQVERAER